MVSHDEELSYPSNSDVEKLRDFVPEPGAQVLEKGVDADGDFCYTVFHLLDDTDGGEHRRLVLVLEVLIISIVKCLGDILTQGKAK